MPPKKFKLIQIKTPQDYGMICNRCLKKIPPNTMFYCKCTDYSKVPICVECVSNISPIETGIDFSFF